MPLNFGTHLEFFDFDWRYLHLQCYLHIMCTKICKLKFHVITLCCLRSVSRRSESDPVRFLRETPSSVAYSIRVRLFDRLFDIVAVNSSVLCEGIHDIVNSTLIHWFIKLHLDQCVFGQEKRKDLQGICFIVEIVLQLSE